MIDVPINEEHLKADRESTNLANFPKQFQRQFETWDKHTKDLWYLGRYKCKKSHMYLAGWDEALKAGDPDLPKTYSPILGMDFEENPHSQLFAHFVQKRPGEGIGFTDLEAVTKKRMILWPRGHHKTAAVRVDIIQTILNYPNIRLCFLTGSDGLAKHQLGVLKAFFEQPSKRFLWLFPEFCLRSIRNPKIENDADPRAWTDVPARLGTANKFTVPCRTNRALVDPTFRIATAKMVKAGLHADGIYIDDLVNETNYRKPTALAKCYQDYLDICPLLDPAGIMYVTGTRYSFGDTYELIQENAREEEKQHGHTIWKFSIKDCWSHGCQNCPHTSVYHDYDINILQPPCKVLGCHCLGFADRGNKDVLFPRTRTHDGRTIGFTLEMLEGFKREYGPEFFANQYENQPIAEGAQTFTEVLIGAQTLFDMKDIPDYTHSMTFFVGDLAYVGQEGRDYSVIFVVRKSQGRLFIIDCLFGNWDSGATSENVIQGMLQHRPNNMYFEKINGWEAIERNIIAYAATLGIPKVPIEWVKGSQAPNAKLIRIGSVKAPLKNRRLWFFAGMPGYETLVRQLIKWPKLGRHDDFADCCGMVVAAPTGYELENPPNELPRDSLNWLQRLNQTNIPADDDTRIPGSFDPHDPFNYWKG